MPLFIVATPIGHLGDITFRAVETLKSVDLVAAEDTRTARKLFSRYEIKACLPSGQSRLIAFHAHSTDRDVTRLLAELEDGKSVALISEAGTPGISDPGYALVSAAAAAGVEIVPIPGVSAVIAAISASGLPTDKFVYLGFLPIKKGRQTLLKSLCAEKRTVVFYESPHRIVKTVCGLAEVLGGERRVVIGRELTKMYEEFFRGTLAEAGEWIASKPVKGEFTVVLGGTTN